MQLRSAFNTRKRTSDGRVSKSAASPSSPTRILDISHTFPAVPTTIKTQPFPTALISSWRDVVSHLPPILPFLGNVEWEKGEDHTNHTSFPLLEPSEHHAEMIRQSFVRNGGRDPLRSPYASSLVSGTWCDNARAAQLGTTAADPASSGARVVLKTFLGVHGRKFHNDVALQVLLRSLGFTRVPRVLFQGLTVPPGSAGLVEDVCGLIVSEHCGAPRRRWTPAMGARVREAYEELHSRCRVLHGSISSRNVMFDRVTGDVFLINWEDARQAGDGEVEGGEEICWTAIEKRKVEDMIQEMTT
ncbi:hypothetical protein HK101_000885, partial [Irineochytrium annulatum]